MKSDQMIYLLEGTVRIEQSLDNLTKNQESLEQVVEAKIYVLDGKITKV